MYDDGCESYRASRQSSHQSRPRTHSGGYDSPPPQQKTATADREVLKLPIPWPLAGFFNCIIGQYLYKDDDFVTLMRKISILAMLIAGTAGLLTAPWMLYQYYLHDTISDLIMSIALIITAVVFWGGYFSIRVTKQVTDGVIRTLMLTCSTLLWTTVTFCNTGFDEKQVGMSIPLMAIILDCGCELPWIMVHMTLLTWCQTYNRSYETVPGAFMLRVPDTRDANGVEKLWLSYMSYLCPAAAIAATYFTKAEQKRQVRVAKKGTDLARNISNELRKYNTDTVRQLIKDAERDDETDQDLVDTFRALVSNLEKYRPFLPNYLLMELSSNSRSSSQNRTHDSNGEPTSTLAPNSNMMMIDSLSDVEDLGYSGDDTSPAVTPSRRRTTSRMSRLSRVSSLTTGTTGTDGVDFIPAGTSNTPYTGNLSLWRGNVTMAIVETKISQWFGSSSNSNSSGQVGSGGPMSTLDRSQDRLSLFADTLNTLAASSKASIHTTVGDQIFLSWNGTNKVAQPEVKAAQFLLHFRESVQSIFEVTQAKPVNGGRGFATNPLDVSGARRGDRDNLIPPPIVVGAAASGATTAYSVLSTSTTRQLNLFYDATWLPALNHLYTMALSHGSLMVDSNVQHAASYIVSAQAVDCIRYRARAAKDSTGSLMVPAAPGARSGAPQLPSEAFTGPSMRPGVVSESLLDHLMTRTPTSPTAASAPHFPSPIIGSSNNSNSRGGKLHRQASQHSSPGGLQKTNSAVPIHKILSNSNTSDDQDRRMTLAFELVSFLDNNNDNGNSGGGADSRKGEEWMYQLQRLEKEASEKTRREDRVTSVLESLSLRKYEEALKEVVKIRKLSSMDGGGVGAYDDVVGGGGGGEARGNYSGSSATNTCDTSSHNGDATDRSSEDLPPLSVAACRLLNACECLYYANASEQE